MDIYMKNQTQQTAIKNTRYILYMDASHLIDHLELIETCIELISLQNLRSGLFKRLHAQSIHENQGEPSKVVSHRPLTSFVLQGSLNKSYKACSNNHQITLLYDHALASL